MVLLVAQPVPYLPNLREFNGVSIVCADGMRVPGYLCLRVRNAGMPDSPASVSKQQGME
jgi:hypothetical protein